MLYSSQYFPPQLQEQVELVLVEIKLSMCVHYFLLSGTVFLASFYNLIFVVDGADQLLLVQLDQIDFADAHSLTVKSLLEGFHV